MGPYCPLPVPEPVSHSPITLSPPRASPAWSDTAGYSVQPQEKANNNGFIVAECGYVGNPLRHRVVVQDPVDLITSVRPGPQGRHIHTLLSQRIVDRNVTIPSPPHPHNHQNGGDRFHWIYLNDGRAVAPRGSEALFHHQNTVEAVQFATDLIHEYGVAPLPGAVGGSVRANFQNGVYSMVLERSTFIPDLERANVEYLVVPGPPGAGKQGGRLSGATASTMHIMRDTQVPEAAWEVVRWFAYDAGLELADGRGGIPYLLDGLRRPQYGEAPWNAFATQILTYQAFPDDFPGVMARHYGPFGRAWSASLSGQKAPSIALQEATAELNALLQN